MLSVAVDLHLALGIGRSKVYRLELFPGENWGEGLGYEVGYAGGKEQFQESDPAAEAGFDIS